MCFAINKDYMSEDNKLKMKNEVDKGLANSSSDKTGELINTMTIGRVAASQSVPHKIPASKCFKHNTQVGVGGKLPDAGKK